MKQVNPWNIIITDINNLIIELRIKNVRDEIYNER